MISTPPDRDCHLAANLTTLFPEWELRNTFTRYCLPETRADDYTPYEMRIAP